MRKMADNLDKATRSRIMAAIRSTDTRPELVVRRGLHARGFRFRLHGKGLPGRPDLVLRRYRTVVFVHGCFWHGHDCRLFRMPRTRTEYWEAKIRRNRERDAETAASLGAAGWRCLTVWECGVQNLKGEDLAAVLDRIAGWILGSAETGEVTGAAPAGVRR